MRENCELTISTTIDNKETILKTLGEWLETSDGIEIFYEDNHSFSKISITQEQIIVSRTGDYEISLVFREGERTSGVLGLASSEGEIFVRTEKCRQKYTKNGIMAHIVYTLEFSAGEQKTSVRITATKRSDVS